MKIGIVCYLRSEQDRAPDLPDDMLEEYNPEAAVEPIAAALRDAGQDALRLDGGRSVFERALAAAVGRNPVDPVFNIAEGYGLRSREAQVAAACEMPGLPCAGSEPLSLALCLDKALAKRVAASHGVATAPFCLIETADAIQSATFPVLPATAKLDAEDSSIGIHRNAPCTTRQALTGRGPGLLADSRSPVPIEPFISGGAVTVVILGTGPAERAVGTMDIAPRQATDRPFVYSIELKRNYRREADYHVPPRVSAESIAAIAGCALAAYRAGIGNRKALLSHDAPRPRLFPSCHSSSPCQRDG